MEYEIRRAPRALTPEQATEMVGEQVDPAVPNVTRASLVVDADTDELQLAYLPVPGVAELRKAVMSIKYQAAARGVNIKNKSRTFGGSPRRPVYGRYGCYAASVMVENPAAGTVLERWAERLQEMMVEFAPDVVDHDNDQLQAVETDWRMGEKSLWTSGVINKSARLPYHRDSFNFPTWSAMPVLRRSMRGGYLRVPEYDLTLECRDGYAVFFPGHKLLHGVTPMSPTRPDGYRYSVVYYALKGMKDCFSAALETAHARAARTRQEQIDVEKMRAGVPRKKASIVVRNRATDRNANHELVDDIDPHEELRP